MGSAPATSVDPLSVDPQALQAAAHRLDAAADLLHRALGGYLAALRFDADPGVRCALEGLVTDVTKWRHAALETAAALRTSAERYIDSETQAVRALR